MRQVTSSFLTAYETLHGEEKTNYEGLSVEKIIVSLPKLKGTFNYEVWALCTKSYLIKEGCKAAISENGRQVSKF